jgi:hypothetical protein
MAKNKNIIKVSTPVYYAYYDEKNGQLLEATNEKKENNSFGIEISYEEFDRFASGIQKFKDYKVGYSRTHDNKTVLSIIQNINDDYAFVNNVFQWICDKPDTGTELIVEWHRPHKKWIFYTSEKCKTRLSTELIPQKFIFFIMLKNDFDFLIRTITIKSEDLISKTIEVEFNSKIEEDINNISIASRLFFQSYGLKIYE